MPKNTKRQAAQASSCRVQQAQTQKVSKATADYQSMPNGPQWCPAVAGWCKVRSPPTDGASLPSIPMRWRPGNAAALAEPPFKGAVVCIRGAMTAGAPRTSFAEARSASFPRA
jgi:hypothetical protein